MQPEIKGNRIVLNKGLNALDEIVLSFVKTLDACRINYVVVSGYVAILFGRSRATEDIDILIEPLSPERFGELYRLLIDKNYWFINSSSENDIFEILKENSGVRVAENKKIVPNFEIKFTKDNADKYSFGKRLLVEMGKKSLFISPIEMQIAYKLYLGGEKDIEDAYFLFSLFGGKLDKKELKTLIASLKAEKTAKKYLQGLYGKQD